MMMIPQDRSLLDLSRQAAITLVVCVEVKIRLSGNPARKCVIPSAHPDPSTLKANMPEGALVDGPVGGQDPVKVIDLVLKQL